MDDAGFVFGGDHAAFADVDFAFEAEEVGYFAFGAFAEAHFLGMVLWAKGALNFFFYLIFNLKRQFSNFYFITLF